MRETEPVSLEINGLPALRYEVIGKKPGGRLPTDEGFSLHTLVGGGQHVHQVIGIIVIPSLARHRENLESVANSFREINN